METPEAIEAPAAPVQLEGVPVSKVLGEKPGYLAGTTKQCYDRGYNVGRRALRDESAGIMESYYTPDTAARVLDISRETIYQLVAKKELRAYKQGYRIRIPKSAIAEFTKRQKNGMMLSFPSSDK